MDKEKALNVIEQIESTFKESSKGWNNKEVLKELNQMFYKLDIICGYDTYLSEKSSSAREQLDIIFSQRKHQKYNNGVESVIHHFNLDLASLKSWVQRNH